MKNGKITPQKSELHKKYRGIKLLPLTPISPEAEQQMLAWGIRGREIKELQMIMSGFRSDLCIENIREIRKRKVKATVTEQGYEFFFFKDKSSYQGRQYGTMWDIPYQLPSSSDTKAWLKKINTRFKRDKKTKIMLSVIGTWTTDVEYFHYCNMLHQKGGELKDCICVDATRQLIELIDDNWCSRYIGNSTRPLKPETGYHDEFVMMNAPYLCIGYSKDFKWKYVMGFKVNGETVMPVLGRKSQKDSSDNIQRLECFFDRVSGRSCIMKGSDVKELNSYDRKLLLELEKLAKKIETLRNKGITERPFEFEWS